MMTDPGAVPREATPLPEDDEAFGANASGMEEGKSAADAQGGNGHNGATGNRRVRKYCRRCNAFKPPRAHHCSICRRCIIKMVRAFVWRDGDGEEKWHALVTEAGDRLPTSF